MKIVKTILGIASLYLENKLQQASLRRWLPSKPSMYKKQSVPLVDDPVGEEVCSLLTFGRDLARKSSPVSPNITSWSCLRERVAVFHRFHPAYIVESAVEFEQLDHVSSHTALLKCQIKILFFFTIFSQNLPVIMIAKFEIFLAFLELTKFKYLLKCIKPKSIIIKIQKTKKLSFLGLVGKVGGVGKICEIVEFPNVNHLKDLRREGFWVFGIVERYRELSILFSCYSIQFVT
ncbi:hypothetical protein BpHYR1_014971 [Brachionus plicatilis]|uniref:Uncharacterized protein n=1 Tax=Brachionus plicatilis TaxID=10195 RepID=A0A3M7QTE6_BRAPC|nr:hypothetical protein BpHYR1_014971 [Brachionus plicatilis]